MTCFPIRGLSADAYAEPLFADYVGGALVIIHAAHASAFTRVYATVIDDESDVVLAEYVRTLDRREPWHPFVTGIRCGGRSLVFDPNTRMALLVDDSGPDTATERTSV